MERSESIKEIATALCDFQSRVGKIKKEANNPFFKSKYASLSSILDVIQEPLTECGLSVMQLPTGENELQTIVMHRSGEYISSTYVMRPTKPTPQEIGSCITYQRRYALGAALSLNIDEDDDGNKASGNDSKKKKDEPNIKEMIDKRKISLSEEMKKPTFMSRLYKNEKTSKEKGETFMLRELMEQYYSFTEPEYNLLLDAYSTYKTANNL